MGGYRRQEQIGDVNERATDEKTNDDQTEIDCATDLARFAGDLERWLLLVRCLRQELPSAPPPNSGLPVPILGQI